MSLWMERLVFGELWSELGKSDLILVTANGVVDDDGNLVMGKGAAREARIKFPGIEKWAGKGIKQLRGFNKVIYGTMLSPFNRKGTQIGMFQVKYHWKQPASLGLMRTSAVSLRRYSPRYKRISMNMPGIGAGSLELRRVLPILILFPNNVHLYLKPEQGAECQALLHEL